MALDAHIRATAAQLFVEHGYEGVSMEQVAAAAGAGKQSLYRRYPNKQSMFKDVFTNVLMKEVMARHDEHLALFASSRFLPTSNRLEQLRHIARSVFDFILERKTVEVFRLFVGERNRFPELRSEVGSMIDAVEDELRLHILLAQQAGHIRKALDPHIARSFSALLTEGPLARALLELPSMDGQAARDAYFDGAWTTFVDSVAIESPLGEPPSKASADGPPRP